VKGGYAAYTGLLELELELEIKHLVSSYLHFGIFQANDLEIYLQSQRISWPTFSHR
jgi:hypothetical protein